MSIKGKLYLLPTTIGPSPVANVIPEPVLNIIRGLSHFIVENERSARRFISKLGPETPIAEIKLYPLNKYTNPADVQNYLNPALSGTSIGLISEAGVPAVADPGSDIVSIAHEKGILVVPCVGPSSILLALMASGFNGQQFIFHGYLPIDKKDKMHRLKILERDVLNTGFTQIFMDTPFRNNKVFEDMLQHFGGHTKICIAADITLDSEYIRTRTVEQWKKGIPNLHKRPCMFLIGK